MTPSDVNINVGAKQILAWLTNNKAAANMTTTNAIRVAEKAIWALQIVVTGEERTDGKLLSCASSLEVVSSESRISVVGFGKKETAFMRSVKHLLACAFVVCYVFVAGNKASLAATCTLTAADFQSLKLSRSALGDQTAVDALPQDRRERLCKTRMAWNHIVAGKWTQEDFRGVTPVDYLSPSEAKIFNKLQHDVAIAILKNMSDSDFKKMHRDWMEQLKK